MKFVGQEEQNAAAMGESLGANDAVKLHNRTFKASEYAPIVAGNMVGVLKCQDPDAAEFLAHFLHMVFATIEKDKPPIELPGKSDNTH